MNGGEKDTGIIIISCKNGNKTHQKRKFDLPNPSLTRPQLKPHVCLNESNCKICSEFINELNQWRKKK